jgi:hypothetical protein
MAFMKVAPLPNLFTKEDTPVLCGNHHGFPSFTPWLGGATQKRVLLCIYAQADMRT